MPSDNDGLIAYITWAARTNEQKEFAASCRANAGVGMPSRPDSLTMIELGWKHHTAFRRQLASFGAGWSNIIKKADKRALLAMNMRASGKTLKVIAIELGVSYERARQLADKGLRIQRRF